MAERGKGKVSLLVVDDDERILELLEHVAERSQWFTSIAMATNGREALAQLFAAERMPDIILTDLSMPQMSGFEFVHALKQLEATKDIPVIMFSSSGLLYDRQHALDAGCVAFFPKPTTFAGLEEVLENVARIATGAAIVSVAHD